MSALFGGQVVFVVAHLPYNRRGDPKAHLVKPIRGEVSPRNRSDNEQGHVPLDYLDDIGRPALRVILGPSKLVVLAHADSMEVPGTSSQEIP